MASLEDGASWESAPEVRHRNRSDVREVSRRNSRDESDSTLRVRLQHHAADDAEKQSKGDRLPSCLPCCLIVSPVTTAHRITYESASLSC